MEIFIIHVVIAGLTLLSGVSGEYTKHYRLDARILRNFSDIGEQTCCKECTAYTNCQSVNYNMLNHSCELNYEHVSGLSGKNSHQEYVYMDKAYCKSLFTSCPNMCNLTCAANQKCQITSNNLQICITTECDPSDVIPDITPRNVRREIDRSRWFWCTIPPTPSRQLYTCNTDGLWVKHYAKCQCWYGTYLDGDVCTECPAGKHLPHIGHVGSGSCISCPAGKYTSYAGRGWCSICPVGHYQSSSGQTSCQPCPAGEFINVEEATSCIKCPAGKYSETPGQTGCLNCPVGYYQSSSGQASCQPCPAGKFINVEGATSCKNCPVGYYQSSSGQTSCQPCPAGKYINFKGATSCKLCPWYTYQPSTGKTSCDPCMHAYGEGYTSC